MKPYKFALAILVLATLACGQYVTATPTELPTQAPNSATALAITATTETELPMRETTETATWTAQVSRAQINVRDEPDGDPTGEYLTAGSTVTIIRCLADWCKISNPVTGWVWRGCLSDNPKKLGCTAK